jgi:ferredoxin
MRTPADGQAVNGRSGHDRAPDIAGNGYRSPDPDPTQLLRPRGPQQRQGEGVEEYDLDTPHPLVPPPPLRTSTITRPAISDRGDWSALGAPASPPVAPPPSLPKGPRLRVDWPSCKAHGLCHELLPEAVRLDEWGYPIVSNQALPQHLLVDARRAVIACPTLALRLVD